MRSSDSRARVAVAASSSEPSTGPGERAVDRDPRLRGRLLKAHCEERCDFRFRRPGAPDVGMRRATLAALIAHGLVGWGACGVLMGALLAAVPEPTAIVVALDVLIVAWLIQGNFAMFSSELGTWVPFALIFVSAFVRGRLLWRGR